LEALGRGEAGDWPAAVQDAGVTQDRRRCELRTARSRGAWTRDGGGGSPERCLAGGESRAALCSLQMELLMRSRWGIDPCGGVGHMEAAGQILSVVEGRDASGAGLSKLRLEHAAGVRGPGSARGGQMQRRRGVDAMPASTRPAAEVQVARAEASLWAEGRGCIAGEHAAGGRRPGSARKRLREYGRRISRGLQIRLVWPTFSFFPIKTPSI
jgi:hypothetical protein